MGGTSGVGSVSSAGRPRVTLAPRARGKRGGGKALKRSPARILAPAFFLLLAAPLSLEARLGGGQSYQSGSSGSGSSSSSRSRSSYRSSSSSSSSASRSRPSSSRPRSTHSAGRRAPSAPLSETEEAITLVFGLGFLVVLVVVLVVMVLGMLSGAVQGIRASLAERPASSSPLAGILARPETVDANFSWVVFLDFVHLLFTRFEHALGSKDFAPLVPWVDRAVLDAAGRTHADLREVREVILGGVSLARVNLLAGEQVLELELRFNATHQDALGSTRSWFRVERWTFRRRAGVLSPAPERARVLGCPSCGAPVELNPQGRCVHCGKSQKGCAWGWRLTAIRPVHAEPLAPLTPGLGGEEAGTSAPSVVDPDLGAARRKLMDRHPAFSMEAFTGRVERIFRALQEAWSRQDEAGLRPYETDRLFESHRFWLEHYKKAGLVNRLTEIAVEAVEPVRIALDAYYEAITVRIRAAMKDATYDAKGTLVGGSADAVRRFSEYWTFVRRAGLDDAAQKPPEGCPSCGAPLAGINQAGICAHCDSKVVTGDFGWVLSRIEQDEEYAG